jgi:hypothetical protein
MTTKDADQEIAKIAAERDHFTKLIKEVEQKMENTSKSYFDTTINFIKWNTAIAIAAILWFGNYIVSTPIVLSESQLFTGIIYLAYFVVAITMSIIAFYRVSHYQSEYWILCAEWRNCLIEPYPSTEEGKRKQSEVSTRLVNYYDSIPKEGKKFDKVLLWQISSLLLGLVWFIGFILMIKLHS